MKASFRNLFILFTFVSIAASAQSSYFSISVNTTKYSCSGGSATILVGGGEPPYFFNWNNGEQGERVTQLLPGDYSVTIIDGTGRDTVVELTILEEKCKVRASTTFSPNGDDINDTWTISHWANYPNFVVEVYNRWGQLVHQQKKEFTPWDGKQLGIDVPVGTYYYIFFYDGKDGDSEQGGITIMR